MSNDTWKKRYSFRLTNGDKDICDFIQSSKETESETIRRLLKFALAQMEKEKRSQQENKLIYNILSELQGIKEQQTKNHQSLVEKIDKGMVIKDKKGEDEEQKKIDQSIENSIDSVLDMFGMTD
ncbi:hypothetical protein WMZ97_16685 [Lentibacillus sp. N15]|uniref:hypothetical protein n=1 Tax=Lentibacillus songyuanensis TaxID=3136161 RepID=UPI0031BA775A